MRTRIRDRDPGPPPMWGRPPGGTLRTMHGDHMVLFDHAGPARPRITGSAAVRRCLIAAGFGLFFTAVGVLAAVVAGRSGLLPLVELCCISSLGAVAVLELRPALAVLRGRGADAWERHAIRAFRSELDALPVTPHPLGL